MSINNVLKEIRSFDIFEYDQKLVAEAIETKGKLMLRGILQNGRIYPKDVLDREIRNYQKFILENRATGEIDHPDSSVVSLKNVSHIIREAHLEGDTVIGTLEVLDKLPSGKILRGLVESGVKIGISSRGVGSTKPEGDYQVVQDDFLLICFDCVSEPSTTGAFMLPEGFLRGQGINSSALNQHFKKSDRIDRIINEIVFNKNSKLI
jgi:hypothetical protein